MAGLRWTEQEHDDLVGAIADVANSNKGHVSTEDVLAQISLDRTIQAVSTKIYSLGLLANKKYVVSNKLSEKKMNWLTDLLNKHGIKTVEGEYTPLERKERSQYENMNMFSSRRGSDDNDRRALRQSVHYTIEREIALPVLLSEHGNIVSYKQEGISYYGVPRSKYESAISIAEASIIS